MGLLLNPIPLAPSGESDAGGDPKGVAATDQLGQKACRNS